MKMLILPRLKMAELQSFAEGFLSMVQPHPELTAQVQAVTQSYDVFKKGMLKNQASSEKKTLDRTRDVYISGLLYTIVAEKAFPHTDPAWVKMLEEVEHVTEKYGFALNKLPYNEQSAQTDNLLDELEALDLSGYSSIARWLDPIREANEAFKIASSAYLASQAEEAGTISASEAASGLEDSINAVFKILFAHMQISKTEKLEKVYQELRALIDSYK